MKKQDDRNYKVYELWFPDGMIYTGMTCQKLEDRWGHNGSAYKKMPHVFNPICEYGWDNIEKIVVASGLSQDEARQKEQELIALRKETDCSLNIRDGGETGGLNHVKAEYCGEYMSTDELLKYASVDIDNHDLTGRLRRGWDVERALTQEKYEKGHKYPYKGGFYTSRELADMCEIEGMTTGNMIYRLKRWNGDVERAMTQPFGVKKQPFGVGTCRYYYNGKIYNSYELTQISSVEGLTSGDITCRINHHGWSVERAITQPKKKHNQKLEYKGKLYTTKELANMYPENNLKNHDITDRLRAGWSIEEAVETPKVTAKKYNYNGKMLSLRQLVNLSPVEGMTIGTMWSRLEKYKWSVEDAIYRGMHQKTLTDPIS